jgi:hypothetical protein
VLAQIKAVLKSIQMPEQLLGVLLEHMKASHVAKNKFHLGAIAGCGESTIRRASG